MDDDDAGEQENKANFELCEAHEIDEKAELEIDHKHANVRGEEKQNFRWLCGQQNGGWFDLKVRLMFWFGVISGFLLGGGEDWVN